MAELKAARSDSGVLADLVRAQKRGQALGIASICSAHPLVLLAAFEQARGDNSSVLVESTSNQVNHEGGYTGETPAEFVMLVSRLAEEAGLPVDRVVLGGDHLGPNPWAGLAAAVAMERAAEMVRHYVRAGYVKLHLDASMRCADDPPGGPPDALVASRTADLAAVAEAAAADRAPGVPQPVYVVGTEVPPPGGQAAGHRGPAATSVADAERSLRLTCEAFARRGLERAWERVLAQVVQPGVEFGDDVVFPYRPEAAAGLRGFAESQERLVFEAHSTDYQDEAALRALVADHFAILKVGPELTFAFREAAFALEAIERELLETRAPGRLSGLRDALDRAMRANPRHWKAYYGEGDEPTLRIRRQFSLSDRARYYWPAPEVQDALRRLFANLDGERLPRGLVSQHLPECADACERGARPGQAARLARLRVRGVLARYARACGLAATRVAGSASLPL
ncbi:MAG TPA: class II D-tagatose-bisphosphate aldolase, non-catalytic subunit [Vicinamibacteria bacterium]|jgi:D-tagatose-1,6-bisphosphate aldolase subunit GatZ/KbaZ